MQYNFSSAISANTKFDFGGIIACFVKLKYLSKNSTTLLEQEIMLQSIAEYRWQ
jgi:hypothetical protein